MSSAPLRAREDSGALQRCWELRHRDPARFRTAVEALPDGPVRSYLRARVALSAGQLDECLRLCDEAEDGLASDEVWHARLLETRGNALNAVGLDGEAQRMLAQAERLYRTAGDRAGLASVIQNIATLSFQSREAAQTLYQEALELARGLNEPALEGTILLNLAYLGVEAGRSPTDLEELASQALTLLDGINSRLAVRVRAMQLELALEAGDVERATLVAATLPAPAELDDSSDRSNVALALHEFHLVMGHPQESVDLLDRVLATQVQDPDLHLLLASRASALDACGRTQEALAASQAAYAALDELRQHQVSASARALDVWHRTALIQQDRQQEKERADALEQALGELRAATQRIHELSIRDNLTQLHNRQHLMDTGPTLMAAASPERPAQVALLDLDRFKDINDTRGHAAGDEVLRAFAAQLRAALPATDLVARYGGEEFVVLRPPTPARPRSLAEDIDELRGQVVDGAAVDLDGQTLPGVTLSVGVVTVHEPDLGAALLEADHRMYAAKRAGGDQVHAGPLVVGGLRER